MRLILAAAALLLAAAPILPHAAAQPAPTPPHDDPLFGHIRGPHLFASTTTANGRPPTILKMCFDAARLRTQLAAPSPEALARYRKGCTDTREHPSAGVLVERRDCTLAAGAEREVHRRLVVTGSGLTVHSEIGAKLPDGRSFASVTDTRATDLGPCPANMKPGDVVTPDGRIMDPAAELARLKAQQPSPSERPRPPP